MSLLACYSLPLFPFISDGSLSVLLSPSHTRTLSHTYSRPGRLPPLLLSWINFQCYALILCLATLFLQRYWMTSSLPSMCVRTWDTRDLPLACQRAPFPPFLSPFPVSLLPYGPHKALLGSDDLARSNNLQPETAHALGRCGEIKREGTTTKGVEGR